MPAPIAAGGLGFDARQGGAIYALYTSMVYLATLPGGWIADRLIGPRRGVPIGGGFIAAGARSVVRRDLHRGGSFQHGAGAAADVLPRLVPDRDRHRSSQRQRQRDR